MKIKATLLMLLFTTIAFGQNGINYKAVITDGSGTTVANQGVTLQFTILEGATSVYAESHTPTTDANGIVIANIGEGTTISGDFSNIAWGIDQHYLNVQVDIGSGLTDMGTTEFKAVPYALNVSGLEAIDEGNGIGWRLRGKNSESYGTIGNIAVDLSHGSGSSNDFGATGDGSFAAGDQTKAFGTLSTAFGNLTLASGSVSTVFGFLSTATGTISFASGGDVHADGNYSSAFNFKTKAESLYSASFGSYNLGGGNNIQWEDNDPIFEIGNGQTEDSRSNALTVLKNGKILAPSLSLAEISEVKSIVTKEYVDSQMNADIQKRINIPASAFSSSYSTNAGQYLTFERLGASVRWRGGDISLFAPIVIPAGSVITGFKAYVFDNTTSSNLRVSLMTAQATSTANGVVIASRTTTQNSPSIQTLSLSDASFGINDTNQFYFRVHPVDGNWPFNTGLNLRHIEVTYTE